MSNPLVSPANTPFETPQFKDIELQHFEPAFTEALARHNKEIENIKGNPSPATFENTIQALEQSGELLDKISSIFFNLNSAETSDEMQQLAQVLSPRLSEHSSSITLDKELFQRVELVYNAQEDLSAIDQRLLEKTYKSFIRNGANLNQQDKDQLKEIDKSLTLASLKFGENVLAETNSYELVLDSEDQLSGLPDYVIEQAKQTADDKGYEDSWVITLQYPSYVPFMTYSDNAELRKELFYAFGSRAAKGNEYDNTALIKEIVSLREQRAKLLGYETHADFVLEKRMAKSADKVREFIHSFLPYAKPAAEKELQDLKAFANKEHGVDNLNRWDLGYYSEKQKKALFDIDDTMLKPYFELSKVLDGVFKTAEKLYHLTFKENTDIQVYHPDVTAYEVQNDKGAHVGVFYADFFPREGKRAGAWMTSYRDQHIRNGEEKRPHISIVCNFSKPTKTKPSLLTLNEVLTLFHEFGHSLHGLLAKGKYGSLSGTNVSWDFVELPSQIFENWVYEPECLKLFAYHYETGELIPTDLVDRIVKSSNYQAGYQTMRQLSFAHLDMQYHGKVNLELENVENFEKNQLSEFEVIPRTSGTVMSCSFSHIFQGGYSAGYYSYKWSEVLDADAFERFKEEGIFNPKVADDFVQYVLSAGDSEEPEKLYKKFRGSEPSVEALLRRSGLINAEK